MDKYNKWLHDYIDDIDITKIEWIKFTDDELREFYQKNYLDRDIRKYVGNQPNFSYLLNPIGLRYLTFDCNDEDSFLLGLVNNSIGKKTIVAAMVYSEDCYLFANQKIPLTYISTLEVNSYFWNSGIYKKLCEEVINFINSNQHILITEESSMGKRCKVIKILKETLKKNGFTKTLWIDNFSYYDNLEFQEIVCAKQKTLK